jgi:DNA-binding transcriptional regulator YiaG
VLAKCKYEIWIIFLFAKPVTGEYVMSMHKDNSGMPTEELQELMNLMGVNRTKLAAMLDLTTNTVDRWFMQGKVASGPPSILLREWLAREKRAARRERQTA